MLGKRPQSEAERIGVLSQPPRVGCVSYLNAKPLIAGAESLDATVRYAVPGELLWALEAHTVDLALCPVIDYFRAAESLKLVPVGGIGCEGPTLTVRLFSRGPLEQLTEVHGDAESHTSVALLCVLMAELYGRRVRVRAYTLPGKEADAAPADATQSALPEAMLLIGDKVVTDAPEAAAYPYQLDLGEAWQELTGLPFVFAVWMARPNVGLGDLPRQLDEQRRANAERLETIVQQYAPVHGWPIDLARQYLTRILQYEIGPRQLQAIAHFAALAYRHGQIESPRLLDVTAVER